MPHDRYYYPGNIEENLEITISGDEHQHLCKVMRADVGDSVEVVNGMGKVAVAAVVEMGKNEASLKIDSVELFPEPKNLTLFLAYIKQNLLEWVVEKVTEIGATRIFLFPAAKSQRDALSENHLRRINALLISALKQSGRVYLPKLETLKRLPEEPFPICFGSFEKGAPHLLSECLNGEVYSFIVGPESGLTKAEEKFLIKQGAKAVSLGENVLRAETAAITAATLIASANACKRSG